MIAFICFFFPAVVALWLFESLTKANLNMKQCIFRFCGNVLSINFLCFAAKKFVFKTGFEVMYSNVCDITPSAAFNYIVISVFFAVILTVFEVLISKKVKVAVEDVENEKSDKK